MLMVHVIAKTRYGGLNEIRKNTPQFIRAFRGLLILLERVSDDYNCSPEAALLMLSEYLPLGDFEEVDDPIHLDVRHEQDKLKSFLSKCYSSPQGYLLSVIEIILRLPITNMTEVIAQFDLARLKLGGWTTTPQTGRSDEPSQKETISEQVEPKRKFKTKKVNENIVKPKEQKPKVVDRPPQIDSGLSKLDKALARSKETLARSKETLAESGQVVPTNPLLNDFL